MFHSIVYFGHFLYSFICTQTLFGTHICTVQHWFCIQSSAMRSMHAMCYLVTKSRARTICFKVWRFKEWFEGAAQGFRLAQNSVESWCCTWLGLERELDGFNMHTWKTVQCSLFAKIESELPFTTSIECTAFCCQMSKILCLQVVYANCKPLHILCDASQWQLPSVPLLQKNGWWP